MADNLTIEFVKILLKKLQNLFLLLTHFKFKFNI